MPKWRGMLCRMPRAGAHEGEIRGMISYVNENPGPGRNKN